jgi:hypothetical protein
MKMPELYPGQNCGMTCYYDENTYIKFAVFATLDEEQHAESFSFHTARFLMIQS